MLPAKLAGPEKSGAPLVRAQNPLRRPGFQGAPTIVGGTRFISGRWRWRVLSTLLWFGDFWSPLVGRRKPALPYHDTPFFATGGF